MKTLNIVFVVIISVYAIQANAGYCDKVLAQDKLMDCLYYEYDKEDMLLNKTYNNLRSRLDEEAKSILKEAQISWISYRDKDCEFAASEAIGGQAYLPLLIDCKATKTAHRTKDLMQSGW